MPELKLAYHGPDANACIGNLRWECAVVQASITVQKRLQAIARSIIITDDASECIIAGPAEPGVTQLPGVERATHQLLIVGHALEAGAYRPTEPESRDAWSLSWTIETV